MSFAILAILCVGYTTGHAIKRCRSRKNTKGQNSHAMTLPQPCVYTNAIGQIDTKDEVHYEGLSPELHASSDELKAYANISG